MDKTIKLILSYHKPDYLLKDSVLTPVHVGRANALKRMAQDDEKLIWMLEHMQGDNTGENISDKNDTFNEMTSVYWAWKNYSQLGNPDYIGFMHYRRHFIFDDKMQRAVYECLDIDEEYCSKIKYDESQVANLMKDCDFACTKPHWRESVYDHFKRNHDVKDLDTAVEIIKEKYPHFTAAAEKYLSGQDAFFCNMFIFPKEIFFDYAAWFFDIAFELWNRVDFTGRRFFVSEWLTGIYLTYLLQNRKKGKFFPMMIAEGEHEIPVVFASDNGYAYPLLVAITSLLQHVKRNTIYIFYLLISEDFLEENKKMIQKICSKHPKTKCHFIKMEHSFEKANIYIKHITRATYYRLKLPSLLPDIKKCIYLDTDIIAKDDLSELYRISIDDKYIAGVRALGYLETDEKIADKMRELHIPSMEQYVNAGVLLMNLEKMRSDHLEDKFDLLLKHNFESQDQDVLNVSCYGKIRLLPFQYNVMTKYPLYSDSAYDETRYLQRWISKGEWNYGRKNPVIIHYADRKKPWTDLSLYFANEWWKTLDGMDSEIVKRILDYYREELVQNAYETERLRKLMVAQRNDLRWEMQHSRTYKIGNIVLYIPKKIRGVMCCVKEHGFGYTVKLCCGIVLGRK